MKFLSDLQFQKNFLKQHKAYLKKGVYVLHDNLRTYILKGYKLDDWLPNSKHSLKNMIKILIARIFYSVRIRDNGTEFSAQAVYFANTPDHSNRDAKFFDYESKRLRTICPNKARFDTYIHNWQYFKNYFPLPDLLFADEEHYVFDEKMIEKRSVPDSEWQTVFQTIFDIYSAYFNTPGIDTKNVVYKCVYMKNEKNEHSNQSITLYRQHGDLSADNFIYDADGKVFFIDYEHADYYPIFYDLFFLIVHSYVWENNDIGIKLLESGAFDSYINSMVSTGISSVYDAFYIYSDYFLGVCRKDGVPEDWCTNYKKIFCDICEKLKR